MQGGTWLATKRVREFASLFGRALLAVVLLVHMAGYQTSQGIASLGRSLLAGVLLVPAAPKV